MRRALFALVLALGAPVLATAQEGVAPPLLLHLTTLGPAGWRARLGPTNLGSMLAPAGEEARAFLDSIEARLAKARADAAAFRRERDAMLGFAGAIQLAVWLERAEDAIEPARWSVALVADVGEIAEPTALAAAVSAWLEPAFAPERLPRAWDELRLQPLRVEAGRLIAVLATPADAAATHARAAALVPAPLPPHTALRLEVDLQRSLGLLRDHAWHRWLWQEVLGTATRRAVAEVGHDGPHCTLDLALEFAAGDRGVCAGLFPVAATAPDLQWLVPEGCVGFHVGHIDFPTLWHTVERAVAAYTEESLEACRARLQQQLGADIAADLGVHLHTDTLWFWADDRGDARSQSLLGNAVLVARLRDPAAKLPKLRPLLADLGLRVEFDKDGELWAARAAVGWAPAITVAVGGGIVCVAFGQGGRDCVEEVMGRAYQGPPVSSGPGAATAAGLGGLGELRVETMVVRHLGSLLMLAAAVTTGLPRPPSRADLAADVERWLPRLRQYGLTRATTVVTSTAARWSLRFRW